MAPTERQRVKQETLRFNLDNPEQAKAIAIYTAMLNTHPYAKSLCTLLPHVLTVFAEQARAHPALNNQTALLIAKHQDKVMALLAMLERGETVPGLDEVQPLPVVTGDVEEVQRAVGAMGAPAIGGEIEVDMSKL